MNGKPNNMHSSITCLSLITIPERFSHQLVKRCQYHNWYVIKRKPNGCMVCGDIHHELGTQQCHTRLKECGTDGLSTSGVRFHTLLKFGFLFMPWFLTFKYPKLRFYLILKKHTIWSKTHIPHDQKAYHICIMVPPSLTNNKRSVHWSKSIGELNLQETLAGILLFTMSMDTDMCYIQK